ncbi:MAG TPA: transcription elongation factor GreA [Beutenbergiaceae bacterium]|nr:transcription elongation factor GreA [Beutenbergiaceae bacterium]
MSESTTWLTQESFDRLQAEYDHLVGEGRAEVARRIDEARQEGDLKENGGYHAAREEQGRQEARIRQLEALLRNAQVGEAPADDGVVEPGMVIEATVGGEAMTFLLGSREGAEDTDLEVYSSSSPLGQAIMGHKTGDTVTFKAPSGASIAVDIGQVAPFQS